MTAIPQDNMEAIFAYLMMEGFAGGQLRQNGETLAAVDAVLAANDYTTQFTDDSMFSKTRLQNLYTEGKNTALGGRFGGRSVTYPYGYSLVRAGTATDNDDFAIPTRNKKFPHWQSNADAFTAQILNLAQTGELTPAYQESLNEGADPSMASGDSAPAETTTTTTVPEVVEEVVVTETPVPAEPVEISGMKIKNPSRLQSLQFAVPEAPTAEEQIGISLKAWQQNQDPDKFWPYEGTLLFTLNPSSSDSTMQPTNTVVVSETSTGGESLDDFMGGDDFDSFMDESPEEIAAVNASANQPYFLTPVIQFSFKAGQTARFRVISGAGAEEYADVQWPVHIANSDDGAVVKSIRVRWAEPSGDFNFTDSVEEFEITLEEAGKTLVLSSKQGELVGAERNQSQESGDSNTVGGMMTKIANDTVIVYGHGVKGFGGLLDASDGEPIDTLTWSDLNASSAGLTGSVKINAATDVPAVIRTQISRFYGNNQISDPRLNWKNWTDTGSPDDILTPIAGGDNVIFNFDPTLVDVQGDVRIYQEFHPEYLAPKLLELALLPIEGQTYPEETDTIGVIVPQEILDDEGDVEDYRWDRTIDFEVRGGDSSEYFGTGQEKNFVLPGDEGFLKFKDTQGNVVDIGKGGINYITYDKPTSITVSDTLVVRGFRIYAGANNEIVIDIPTSQDTGSVWLEDPNGKLVGGTIKGGELSPPAPEIMVLDQSSTEVFNQRQRARRRLKQSDRFTQRDDTGAVVTRSIAFKTSPTTKEYYVLAETTEGMKLMKIDLDVRRD